MGRFNFIYSSVCTYTMEQRSSCEANRPSTSQVIPRILWHQRVHYLIYKSLPHVLILRQINPAHAPHPNL